MDYRDRLIVKPGEMLHLKDADPAFKGHQESQAAAAPELEQYRQKLVRLQALLYAEKKHSVLIVLQGLDAGGKDGTIKHVFGALNPQGASVAGFKQPTPIELDHDFLWRVHPHAPPKGWVGIFNRSHYEDVLVTRVHKLVDKSLCESRYELIRAFELGLKESGTTILKFFLHISKEEQLVRFGKRLDDPARNWKISESDYSERELWYDYIKAFEDALSATSTHEAPWYVIPSNHKWFAIWWYRRLLPIRWTSLACRFQSPRSISRRLGANTMRRLRKNAKMREIGRGKTPRIGRLGRIRSR